MPSRRPVFEVAIKYRYVVLSIQSINKGQVDGSGPRQSAGNTSTNYRFVVLKALLQIAQGT